MKKGQRRKPTQKTKHHKVPRSRCRKGEPQPDNVLTLENQYHEAWHHLFGNRTPFEIVIFLIEKVTPHGYVLEASLHAKWQGAEERYHYKYRRRSKPFEPVTWTSVQVRAWEKLFEGRSYYSVLAEILTGSRWTPRGYFRAATVDVKGEGRITLSFCEEDES